MRTPDRPTIALIGAGPRGASLIERIGAQLRDPSTTAADPVALDLHVIDDAESGAGRIWRTDQTRELCMNTLADAVTMFTEPGSTVRGPIIQGPTLYEWCLLALHEASNAFADPEPGLAARVDEIPHDRRIAFEDLPVRAGFAADYRDELEALRPESHPSRALYGEYLAWCFDRACAQLPAGVRLIRHRARAVSIRREGSLERITLSDGGTASAHTGASTNTELLVGAVIAAPGWLSRLPPPAEQRLIDAITERPTDLPRLTWVRPDSPVDQDLSGVPAGADVIVRGLGMGFFDTMALLTIGRGGRFVADASRPYGLRYEASGHEPILHATSRRGVPFRAKSLYRSLPPRPEQRHLRGVDWSAMPRPIDFDHALWPRIIADALVDHATTLHRLSPSAFAAPLATVLAAIDDALVALLDPATRLEIERQADAGDEQFSDRAGSAAWLAAVPRRIDEAIAPHIPDPADRLDLVGELDPAGHNFTGPTAYGEWLRDRVARDLAEAELGRDSALKAGLWSLSAARGFASRLGTLGGFDAESRAAGFATLFAVGGLAGSGPPAFRNRQLLALIDAGLVRFIGPEALLDVRPEGFVARSPRVPGSDVTSTVLVDAWMHSHDAAHTADPLVSSLIAAGRARPFAVASRTGGSVATRALDVDGETGRLIGADGRLDPAVHFAGIPVDEAIHDTIISPMPGTDPTMLRETDRVALSALEIARAAQNTATSEPARSTT